MKRVGNGDQILEVKVSESRRSDLRKAEEIKQFCWVQYHKVSQFMTPSHKFRPCSESVSSACIGVWKEKNNIILRFRSDKATT